MRGKITNTSFGIVFFVQVDTTNIAANSFYIYRVSAFNLVTVGDTMYSPEATIPASAVPTAPTVSFVTSTETTITVSWDIPLSDLTVTGFRLYVPWDTKLVGSKTVGRGFCLFRQVFVFGVFGLLAG